MKLERDRATMALYGRIPAVPEFQSDPSFSPFGPEPQAKQESLWAIIDDRMRGRWKYATILGLGLALVLGVLGYASAKPMYQGMGAIEIKPNTGIILSETPEHMALRENHSAIVATQVQYMKQPRCLQQALQDPELAKLPWAKQPDALKQLKKGLTVKPDRDSRLVFVTFDSEDPVVAQAAANAVMHAYYDIWGKNGGNVNLTLETVSDHLRKRERELRNIRTAREEVLRTHETTDLRGLQNWHMERIGELTAQISLGKRLVQRRSTDEASSAAAPKVDPAPAQLETLRPYLTTLRTQRDEAQLAFDSIKNSRHPTSSVYLDRQAKADQARQLYEKEYKDALREWEFKGGALAIAAPGSVPVTEQDIQTLEAELAELKERQSKLTKDLAYIETLSYQEEHAELLVNQAQARLSNLETEVGQLMNTINIAAEALRPDEPNDDARRKRAIVGVGLGLMASFGSFFLLGSIDRRAFGASQLHKLGTKSMPPCLGVLPDLSTGLSDPDSSDVASHCVHQIRNQIEALRDPTSGYVLAVTSPFQGDGKTSIVMALGWSYAAAGYKTLLVDCDMVGRSLTRQLGLIGREGLKDALLASELNGSVARLPVEHLNAVPVGVDNRFGPENVRRSDLQRLFEQVRSEYDIILVDTGPMLGALESTPVTAIADGVVLSVRRGRSRSRLEDCVSRLEMLGTRCVGVILNCAARSDCNRYVSEASLAAAEEERATRADAVEQVAVIQPAPGERNALVRAVQSTTRTRIGV